MALAGGGEFVTMPVTEHIESHVSIIGAFLNREIVLSSQADRVRVRVAGWRRIIAPSSVEGA
jgi:RNA 3'-terminal phosphate cyclase